MNVKGCILWPSFSSLNGEQGKHSSQNIIVVKQLWFPFPPPNFWWALIVWKNEIFSPFSNLKWKKRLNIASRSNFLKQTNRFQRSWLKKYDVLTIVLGVFAVVCAVKKFAIEELDSNNSKDEMEKHVDNKNIENVLQWIDYTVKHCFQFWDALNCLQWSQDSKYAQRFDGTQILTGWTPPNFCYNVNFVNKRIDQ